MIKRNLQKKNIFISHIHEEVNLAKILREPLAQPSVKPLVNVFLSEEIPPGEFWFEEMMKALQSADILIVLCSPFSVERPWINFEIGAVFQREAAAILPVCHSGLAVGNLQDALSRITGVEAGKEVGLVKLYTEIASRLGWPQLTINAEEISAQVRRFEAEYMARRAAEEAEDNKKFCPVAAAFDKVRSQLATARNRRPAGPSNLWYVWINTELFEQARDRIVAIFLSGDDRERSQWNLSDATVWSLLGAAEMVIRFRSDESTARSIEARLRESLQPPDATSESSLLESTSLNPEGITVLQIVQEMVPDRHGFEERPQFPSLPFIGENRSIKVFIKLYFPHGLEPGEKTRILFQLPGFTSTVESFAITRESGNNPVSIVVEAHYPCGHFSELQDLSASLEKVLRQRLVKETYLAYSVVKLSGELAEEASPQEVVGGIQG